MGSPASFFNRHTMVTCFSGSFFLGGTNANLPPEVSIPIDANTSVTS